MASETQQTQSEIDDFMCEQFLSELKEYVEQQQQQEQELPVDQPMQEQQKSTASKSSKRKRREKIKNQSTAEGNSSSGNDNNNGTKRNRKRQKQKGELKTSCHIDECLKITPNGKALSKKRVRRDVIQQPPQHQPAVEKIESKYNERQEQDQEQQELQQHNGDTQQIQTGVEDKSGRQKSSNGMKVPIRRNKNSRLNTFNPADFRRILYNEVLTFLNYFTRHLESKLQAISKSFNTQ